MTLDAATDSPDTDRMPRATYRLQFNRDCTLARACTLISYFHDLGVSHLYASPLLKAVPGSSHGYDICDFHEMNAELGTLDDFSKLHDELALHQMGLVLDVVPNHMGIDDQSNRWWWDVLAHGPGSQYAGFFDIDWQSRDPRLRNKIAMPILTERYNEALLRGSIRLVEKEGSLCLECAGKILPVSPESVSTLLDCPTKSGHGDGAEAIREAAAAELNNSPEALDEFIQKQHYLLMFWRNGHSMLNYRRFFTIVSLAGIRIEEKRVFDQAFELVKQWLDKGWVDGLRVDHVDGLRRPEQFLQRLRAMAQKAWIVVEKILEPGEALISRWPVHGTTGYDFLNNLNRIFIDPRGEQPFSEFYTEFTGESLEYPAVVRAKKHTAVRDQFMAETNRLTDLLVQISARHWECRDFTRAGLTEAWTELAIRMPVYRTYADPSDEPEVSKHNAKLIQAAATSAREDCQDLPAELFDFLEELLLLRRRGSLEDDFVLRFQQMTGPLMAKAVEDTAFYCYVRFPGLNEVGGDPGRFGLSVANFHQFCRRQQARWPASMAATATHDTKWGGDVRARLALLSERPQEWIEAVRRWTRMNEAKRFKNWPGRKIEYLFYHALVGAWPLSKERALAYVQKAAREAKEQTRWRQPVAEYEQVLQSFVGGAMDDPAFVRDVERFVAPLLDLGRINSLAQSLVKMTATGVPDFYQGSELWDLSLTDPDNRHPVDFALRQRLLTEAKTLSAKEAWQRRESGLPKLWLIWKVLAARRLYPTVFGPAGDYEPLPVSGARAPHVLAFTRARGAVTVAPRLVGGFDGNWDDTTVELPAGRWRNVLTDSPIASGRVAALLSRFPVALLLREGVS